MPTSYWVVVGLAGAAFLVEEIRRFDRQLWLWRYERAQSKAKFVLAECVGLVLGTVLTSVVLGNLAWFLVFVGGAMPVDWISAFLNS